MDEETRESLSSPAGSVAIGKLPQPPQRAMVILVALLAPPQDNTDLALALTQGLIPSSSLVWVLLQSCPTPRSQELPITPASVSPCPQ